MIEVTVAATREFGTHTRVLELRPIAGELPRRTAGAHIDIEVPGIGPRSYSLCNPPAEEDRYVVAVRRELRSRGGSVWLCDSVAVGDRLSIEGPRNHFPLDDSARPALLLAGGIGITPLLAMAYELTALGRPWTLWYSAKSDDQLVLADEFERIAGENGVVHTHTTSGGTRLDLAGLIAGAPDAEVFACGPVGMLEDVQEAGAADPSRLHWEYFEPTEQKATDTGYEVELASTGERVPIPPGKTILDVFIDRGMDVEYSCSEGTCGTCETRVLAGRVDHRDVVLTQRERDAGDVMMICCSGSLDPVLVLDV